MTKQPTLDDLEYAALVASKVCHEVVGPVGAIFNALEVLEGDNDPASRLDTLDIIRSFAEQAKARLEFARLAFGSSSSHGTVIDLATAERVAQGLIATSNKHKLIWPSAVGQMEKNPTKLLLNLIAIAATALPRGGEISVAVEGSPTPRRFALTCVGEGARAPQYLPEVLSGGSGELPAEARVVQVDYAMRLGAAIGMPVACTPSAGSVLLTAGKS